MASSLSRFGLLIAASLLQAGTAFAGLPYPTGATPKAVDVGALSSAEAPGKITVTVAMRLHDYAGATARVESLYDPKSAEFRKFLTPEQFRAQYAPTTAEIARVTASLSKFGLSVSRASSSTLSVTGTPAALERAFQVSLHQFEVPARGEEAGYRYRAPLTHPTVPEEASALVSAVFGLSTQPHFRPHLQKPSVSLHRAVGTPALAKPNATGNPAGLLTVADFAATYNVNPLYKKGVDGTGRTLGIVTLASFTPSDAFAYWAAVGLTVDPNRITVVNIDGGAGAPSDASGSDETTLDVEQSGGVAPGASIIVYVAPNTNQAFVDAFAQAIDSNRAESVSTSWGEWEWFDNIENAPITEPNTGRPSSVLQSFHQLFLQAALQGQSLFASSGDSGAYDVNGGFDGNGNPIVPPFYSLALSVDSPASDPYITAAGGTTLPGTQTFGLPGGLPNFVVNIKQEQVWSWSYLNPLCAELGFTPISCGIFPVGSGGGVSIIYPTPFYQFFLPGVQATQPHQAFVDFTVTPPQVIDTLPGHFPGRNVPDLSANADPDTGYVILYTSSQGGFEELTFIGGTSFVAPQLNGLTALFGQYVHGRVGLLNFPLYAIARSGGYRGPNAPLRAIRVGDNDFYTGSDGYNPAAGLGVPNAAGLAEALRDFFFFERF
jgi:kumamolisin